MRKKLDQYEYNAKSLIGDGGFAHVYRARDKHENKNVAVKILKTEFEQNTYVIEAFFRDPQIVKKLEHKNIVQILDVGNMLEKPYFFAMEYCEGGDLKNRMQQGKPLPIPIVLNHSIQLCGALEYIHAAELYHRDIKASNILYRDNDTPLFTDFGIAIDDAEIKNVLKGNHNIGSPPYMSPEVWMSKGYDASSDLYSFGILMYYSLTGVFPFIGKSPDDYKKLHLQSKPIPPSLHRSGISKELDTLILGLLEKDQRHRVRSARDLQDYLRTLLRQTDDPPAEMEMKNLVIYLESNQQDGIIIHDFPFSIGKRGEPEDGVHNDLVIRNDDPSISRFHAVIDRANGGFVFTDRSTNGSIINGTRIRGRSISLGDENKILLGHKTKMIIRAVPISSTDEEETKPEISTLTESEDRNIGILLIALVVVAVLAVFLVYSVNTHSKKIEQPPWQQPIAAQSSQPPPTVAPQPQKTQQMPASQPVVPLGSDQNTSLRIAITADGRVRVEVPTGPNTNSQPVLEWIAFRPNGTHQFEYFNTLRKVVSTSTLVVFESEAKFTGIEHGKLAIKFRGGKQIDNFIENGRFR